jgi:hypothetical protein
VPDDKKTIEPIGAPFDAVAKAMLRTQPPKEITPKAAGISVLAGKSGSKEISPYEPELDFGIETERDVNGIGMGVLKDGTPYLNQRGLARLCGVQNAHIGTISSQWADDEPKPRIAAIKAILAKSGYLSAKAHIEIMHNGIVHYCYPAEICLAVLEYYAFDAGTNCQPEARDNFRLLAGSKLRELIYSQVGYDPSGKLNQKFQKWHERLAINNHASPRGFFDVFTEADTVIYELIVAGAPVGDTMIPDGSIGIHWSKHWEFNGLDRKFGPRKKYPHNYPESHPQSKANPVPAWCYPIDALGQYRIWLQEVYIEGGKLKNYLVGKVSRGELPPSVAQLAIATMTPAQIEG